MVFKTVHGMTGTKPFHRWADMTKRCHAKYHHAYKYYGARGINVCNRWRNSFLDYYGDVGEPATPDLSIDRINNDGGYWCGICEDCKANGWPKNWQWATKSEQCLNRRVLHSSGGTAGRGYTKVGNKYMVQITASKKTYYLGLYKTTKEASYVSFIAKQIRSQEYLQKPVEVL